MATKAILAGKAQRATSAQWGRKASALVVPAHLAAKAQMGKKDATAFPAIPAAPALLVPVAPPVRLVMPAFRVCLVFISAYKNRRTRRPRKIAEG